MVETARMLKRRLENILTYLRHRIGTKNEPGEYVLLAL
jgi:hypothetical protein